MPCNDLPDSDHDVCFRICGICNNFLLCLLFQTFNTTSHTWCQDQMELTLGAALETRLHKAISKDNLNT